MKIKVYSKSRRSSFRERSEEKQIEDAKSANEKTTGEKEQETATKNKFIREKIFNYIPDNEVTRDDGKKVVNLQPDARVFICGCEITDITAVNTQFVSWQPKVAPSTCSLTIFSPEDRYVLTRQNIQGIWREDEQIKKDIFDLKRTSFKFPVEGYPIFSVNDPIVIFLKDRFTPFWRFGFTGYVDGFDHVSGYSRNMITLKCQDITKFIRMKKYTNNPAFIDAGFHRNVRTRKLRAQDSITQNPIGGQNVIDAINILFFGVYGHKSMFTTEGDESESQSYAYVHKSDASEENTTFGINVQSGLSSNMTKGSTERYYFDSSSNEDYKKLNETDSTKTVSEENMPLIDLVRSNIGFFKEFTLVLGTEFKEKLSSNKKEENNKIVHHVVKYEEGGTKGTLTGVMKQYGVKKDAISGEIGMPGKPEWLKEGAELKIDVSNSTKDEYKTATTEPDPSSFFDPLLEVGKINDFYESIPRYFFTDISWGSTEEYIEYQVTFNDTRKSIANDFGVTVQDIVGNINPSETIKIYNASGEENENAETKQSSKYIFNIIGCKGINPLVDDVFIDKFNITPALVRSLGLPSGNSDESVSDMLEEFYSYSEDSPVDYPLPFDLVKSNVMGAISTIFQKDLDKKVFVNPRLILVVPEPLVKEQVVAFMNIREMKLIQTNDSESVATTLERVLEHADLCGWVTPMGDVVIEPKMYDTNPWDWEYDSSGFVKNKKVVTLPTPILDQGKPKPREGVKEEESSGETEETTEETFIDYSYKFADDSFLNHVIELKDEDNHTFTFAPSKIATLVEVTGSLPNQKFYIPKQKKILQMLGKIEQDKALDDFPEYVSWATVVADGFPYSMPPEDLNKTATPKGLYELIKDKKYQPERDFIRQFGYRSLQVNSQMPLLIGHVACQEYARILFNRSVGDALAIKDLSVFGRPGLMVNRPIYVKSRNAIVTVDRISTSLSFGSEYTTAIQTRFLRSQAFLEKYAINPGTGLKSKEEELEDLDKALQAASEEEAKKIQEDYKRIYEAKPPEKKSYFYFPKIGIINWNRLASKVDTPTEKSSETKKST